MVAINSPDQVANELDITTNSFQGGCSNCGYGDKTLASNELHCPYCLNKLTTNVNESGEVPPKMGTAPIPENHIRLFSYTKGNPEEVRKQGLLLSKARGHTYGEPDLVWGSTLPPESHHNIVEYHIHRDDPRISHGVSFPYKDQDLRQFERMNNHVGLVGDVKPHEMIGIHEPWHGRYHYIKEHPNALKETIAGEHDHLLNDKEYGPAIRKIKSEHVANKLTGHAIHELSSKLAGPDSGFSYQVGSGREPTKGYMVSPYPERSFAIHNSELKPSHIAKYIVKNKDALSKPNNHLGAWHNPENGKVYLDVAVHTNNEDHAKRLALKHDQISYFDLNKGNSVTVNPKATSEGVSNVNQRPATTNTSRHQADNLEGDSGAVPQANRQRANGRGDGRSESRDGRNGRVDNAGLEKSFTQSPRLSSDIHGKVPIRDGKPVPITTKTLYHVTKRETAKSILEGGFDLNKIKPRWMNDLAVSTNHSLKSAREYFMPRVNGKPSGKMAGDRVVLEVKAKGRFYDRDKDGEIQSHSPQDYTHQLTRRGFDMARAGATYIHNPKAITSIRAVGPEALEGVNNEEGSQSPWRGSESTSQTGESGLQNSRGVRGSSSKLESPSSAPVAKPLTGLPPKAKIPGVGEVSVGPSAHIRQVAASYMRKARLPYNPPKTYVKVDPERAKKIADEYDKMPHDPNHPVVKAAYHQMAKEVIGQYKAALKGGLKVDFIDHEKHGDPYAASPRKAIEDIQKNNHMWVFPTSAGFGSGKGGTSKEEIANNPLLRDSGHKISGKPASVNDLFRVVHDYYGHAKEGNGMRAQGEENAWRSHAAMFSPLARRAMTSETRGQNSWVNSGPHAEHNKHASGADTVYADQKTGLMPHWVSEEGAGDSTHNRETVMLTMKSPDFVTNEMGIITANDFQGGCFNCGYGDRELVANTSHCPFCWSNLIANAEEGAAVHGEGHGKGHAMTELGSHGVHVGKEVEHTGDIVHHFPKAVQDVKAMIASRMAAGRAVVGEAGEHVEKAVKHRIAEAHGHGGGHEVVGAEQGSEGHEHIAGGEHGGEHGAGHEGGGLPEFFGALGAIAGGKAGAKLESIKHRRLRYLGLGKSIQDRANDLTHKMAKQHGAASPYLHAAATTAAIAAKMAAGHALAGQLAGHLEHHLGEHLAHAISHGAGEFGAFAVPAVGLTALAVHHALGHVLKASGIPDTELAKKAGDVHRYLADTRAVHHAHTLLHAAGEHIGNITSLHLPTEGKLIGRHAEAVQGAAEHAVRGSEAKRHIEATLEAAKGAIHGAGRLAAESGRKFINALQLPPAEHRLPSLASGRRLPLQLAGNKSTMTSEYAAANLFKVLMMHGLRGLKESGLADKLNTPEGHRLILALIHRPALQHGA